MSESSEHEETSQNRTRRMATRYWRLIRRPLLVSLAYLAGYMALDVATEGLKGSLEVSLWFPPVGLTLALLLAFGWRYALVVAPVFCLHLVLFRDGLSYPVALLPISVLYTVLYGGAVVLLIRVVKIDPRLARMRDVAWFVGVACFLAPLLVSAEMVSGFVLTGYVPSDAFWSNFLGFWAGDATGIAVLAPFLLVASRPFTSLWAHREPADRTGFRPPSPRELPEVILQVLALALSLAAAYGGARGASLDYAYLAFAPLMWISLRGGFERTTVAVLTLNVSVVVLVGASVSETNPTLLQFGLMALTLVGLLLGGQTTEREKTEEAREESERRFRSVVHNSSEAITILDPDGTVRYVSPAFERLFGYEPEEIVSENINDYIHPEDLPHVAREAEKALAKPGVARNVAEHRLRHKDGSWRYVETTGTYLLDDPAVRGVVVNARDVSGRKEAEEALKESEARFRTAFEDAPIGVALVSLDMRYLRVNQALCEMLGYSEEEMLEKTAPELIHPADRDISEERARQAQEEGLGSYSLERRYVRADGSVAWNLTSVSLIQDSEGAPSHFVCLHQDTTERKELEEELARQALRDSLTGLGNRRLLIDRLAHALERREGSAAVLFLDLDDFKVVNDSFGHETGDELLVAVARRLEGCLRPEDTLARLGGDEFTVLLDEADLDRASKVAERTLEELKTPFDLTGHELTTSASIGVALEHAGRNSRPEDLLKEADIAMYRAKQGGKGSFAIFEYGS